MYVNYEQHIASVMLMLPWPTLCCLAPFCLAFLYLACLTDVRLCE